MQDHDASESVRDPAPGLAENSRLPSLRRLSWRKKLLFGITTATLLLLVFEFVGRFILFVGPAKFVTDDGQYVAIVDYGHAFPKPRPDFRGRIVSGEFLAAVATDLDGCRISATNSQKAASDAAQVELIVVGDSVTFGWGVEYKQTFAEVLARNIVNDCAIRGDATPVVSTVNLGCPATGLYSQRLRLERHLNTHKSQAKRIVIWTLLLNDGFGGGNDLVDTARAVLAARSSGKNLSDSKAPRSHLTEESRRPAPRSSLYSIKSWLSRRSVSYELAMRLFGRSVRSYVPIAVSPKDRITLDGYWTILAEQINAAEKLVESHGGEVLFGYYPYFHDVASGSERTLEKLRGVLSEDTRLVSLLAPLHGSQDTYCFPRDGHPNATGHEVIANAYLQDALLMVRSQLDLD